MQKTQKYFNKRKCDFSELPDIILIESFMGCNLRCKMCPVPDSQKNMNGRKYSSMSFQTFKTIVDQISSRRRTVRLNQLGEPLLNPQIADFVSYAAAKGHRVELTTNGTKLDALLAERLIRAGLGEIIFSFDGCNKETYEKIRVGADFDKVLGNISGFQDMVKRLKSPCSMRVDCIVSDLTLPELEDIRNFWEQRKIPVCFIPLDDWAGKLELPAEYGIKRTAAKRKSSRYPCHLLWSTLSISSEGRVILCCHDYGHLSDLPSVMERPLQDIWTTEIKNMRIKHVTNAIQGNPCRSCDAWMTMPEYHHQPAVTLDSIKAMIRALLDKL